MKRKLVSVLLAAVMTVSSLSITSAASVDADDFISSEETVVEHEQETDEEQEDQLQTETETPSQTSSGTDIGDVTAGEDIITDTPTSELPTDDYVGCGFCEAVKRLDGRSLAHDPL